MNTFLKKNFRAAEHSIIGWEFKSDSEIEKKYKNKIEGNELKIVTDSGEFTLQSYNDMEKAVEVWCEQFLDENISYKSIFVIYGFGDVRYLRKIMKKYPENLFFVYEPFEYVIVNQMYKHDISDILRNDKLYVFTGKNRYQALRDYMGNIITYENFNDLVYGLLPNYVRADVKQYCGFKECLDYFIYDEIQTARLLVGLEELRGRNFLYNLDDFVYQSGIKNLKKAFSEKNLDDYPAIIVSAGPSLEKNIDKLFSYKEKAFLVGVNASLRILKENNIIPDIMVSYDARISDITPFEDDEINTIPLLTTIVGDYRVVKRNKARRFFGYENNDYINKMADKLNVEINELDTGGSVATAAFALAQAVGFKTIILIGQDLAYTDNKIHAGKNNNENKIDSEESDYIKVKGVCGDVVITDSIMCAYRRWFENRIKDYPDLTVINATEGGAVIEGATHMRLDEALNKYCVGKNTDFRKVIDQCGYTFTDEERGRAIDIIKNTENNIGQIKNNILERKKIYEKLDMLNRKHKYNTSEFKKTVEKAGNIEKEIEDSLDMELVKLFVNKADVSVKNKLREKEGNIYDEIKLVVDAGTELLDGYALACDKLQSTWEEVHNLVETEDLYL